MTDNREASREEIRRLRKVLTELGELAEHAGVTGSLERGVHAAVRRYNAVLQRLRELGSLPGSFSQLGDEVSFDEIKVECTMLASYLDDDHGGSAAGAGRGRRKDLAVVAGLAPFVEQRELLELLRTHEEEGQQVDPEILMALAPFLPKSEVTRLVRQHLRQLGAPSAETRSEPSRTEPAPPTAPPSGLSVPSHGDATRHRLAALDARIDELSTRLRDADLAEADRSRLTEELARSGGERTALRRQMEQE